MNHCAAALLHALGFLSFSKLVSGEYELSGYVTAAIVSMIAITSFGGIVFYHESVTATKILGLLFTIVGAFLLTKR